MSFRRYRHRRWIALVALIGLLFQQFAMAAYLCPQEIAAATAQISAERPPCHTTDTTDTTDLARCHQHCHPTTASADHAPTLTVPPALLPATTWLRERVCLILPGHASAAYPLSVRAQPPPLSIQHCTFQI